MKILLFLSLFITLSCKPKAKRSIMERKRPYSGLVTQPHIAATPNTYKILSSDMHLTSDQNALYDVDYKVVLNYISDQSLKLMISKKGSGDIVVSDSIPRNYEKPSIKSSDGTYHWNVYRKGKIKDLKDPEIEYTVTLLVLSDFTSFSLRLDTVDGERIKTVNGTAVVSSSNQD